MLKRGTERRIHVNNDTELAYSKGENGTSQPMIAT